jgi:hypothetical protein
VYNERLIDRSVIPDRERGDMVSCNTCRLGRGKELHDCMDLPDFADFEVVGIGKQDKEMGDRGKGEMRLILHSTAFKTERSGLDGFR